MTPEQPVSDAPALERRLSRLAFERTALFGGATNHGGLSTEDRRRLGVIERELDECFTALRQRRAVNDAKRFDRDQPFFRRPIERPRRP
jgi:hypothetical protein